LRLGEGGAKVLVEMMMRRRRRTTTMILGDSFIFIFIYFHMMPHHHHFPSNSIVPTASKPARPKVRRKAVIVTTGEDQPKEFSHGVASEKPNAFGGLREIGW